MKPTERFSSRVADYVRYRPSYPAELIPALRLAGALRPGSVVADMGSGTGLLTRLFLAEGYRVCGVEPNAEMRAAGELELRIFDGFTSVAGSAEGTTLADASMDLVVAGQAFHWFDRGRAKREFQRILRGGVQWVALAWNERLVDASAFLRGYEDLLRRWCPDYAQVDHRQITPEVIAGVFAPNSYQTVRLSNRQVFDHAGVRGRLLSSSYAPAAGHPGHGAMVEALGCLFDAHQVEGEVSFDYETVLYVGGLGNMERM
jgi:SAM-dependent methyltransferase